ncbi:WW domain containing protein [Ceratobasidium theobromae]|uniref:WW domain containing protein n=1 Tax=Ceratobasidium theobromae TaxID=1582974 RepID=A0A5N5QI94_9AGAM|nr:WW domain containing protein [Ceratobasidium theobromae]
MTQGLDLPSQLIEQLPSETRRYDDTNAGPYVPITIPIGPLGADMFVYQLRYFELLIFFITIVPHSHAGWKHHSNPTEGRSYFWNSELHVLTSSDILDPSILQQVAHWAQVIRPYVLRKFVEAGANYDIVLDSSGSLAARRINRIPWATLRSLSYAFKGSAVGTILAPLQKYAPSPSGFYLGVKTSAGYLGSLDHSFDARAGCLLANSMRFSTVVLAHIMGLLTRNRIAYLYGARSNSGDGGRFTSSRHPPSVLKATLFKDAISALVAYLSSFSGAPYLPSLIRSRDTEDATYYDPHAEVRHPPGFLHDRSGSKLELK